MKTQRLSIIMLIIVFCLIWSASVMAAQYDPIVEQVQQQLIERGYDPGPADGKMGKKTANAIKSFQKDNGLLVSGELNEATLKRLGVSKEEEPPAAVEPTPKEEQPAAVEPTPKEEQPAADSDPSVERVQLELIALDYDPGPADGKMGKKTVEALKKYQEENTLEATGELDEATLKKLKIKAPKIECSSYSCKVEYGLTDEMVEQIKKHFKAEKNADELRLKNPTSTDLKKLPALQEGLTELTVTGSKYVTDISPLKKLHNLQKLTLEYLENLTDIKPIENLPGLTYLVLRRLGQPINISPLRPLVNLERIILSELNKKMEGPFDISALSGKPKLNNVLIYYVKVQDISPLQDSTELTTLRLDGVITEDLSPLKAFEKLDNLNLSSLPATDLNLLGELTELTHLAIASIEVSELSFLSSLDKLKYLKFKEIPAKDMSPVGDLSELKGISLHKTSFDDYSPLAKCTQLENLTARYEGEGFDNLDVITFMPDIRQIWLDKAANVQKWDALATAENLESFSASKTSFSDLKLLANKKKLANIQIDDCKVKNPEAITDLPKLKYLYLRNVEGIDDLAIFKHLWKIADLSLYHKKEQFPQEQIDTINQAKEAAKKLNKIVDDQFSNNNNKWVEGSREESELKIEGGKYLFEHKREEMFWISWNSLPLDYSQDFSIEVSMNKVYGPENSGYGMIWGVKDANNHHQFLVNGNGAYTYAKTVDGNWETLIDWTESPYVEKGNATNIVSIRRLGERLQLYVNYGFVGDVAFEEVLGLDTGFFVYGPTKIEIDRILVKGTKVE